MQDLRDFLGYNKHFEPRAGDGEDNPERVQDKKVRKLSKKGEGNTGGRGPDIPTLKAWGPAQDPWAFEAAQFH